MIRIPYIPFILSFVFLFLCCGPRTDSGELPLVQKVVDSLKNNYAPDKRVAVFNVTVRQTVDSLLLEGETNLNAAYLALEDVAAKNSGRIYNRVVLLPQAQLGDSTVALVTISVANLRSQPKHSAELATQATLGTPLKVLKKKKGWYYVQTPDDYLAWVDDGGIQLMDGPSLETWQAFPKIVYTNTYGHAYVDVTGAEVVSDLVAGNVLRYVKYENGFYVVVFPDERMGMVSGEEAMDYQVWLAGLEAKPEQLVATAKRFMGVPYLWGGTSAKGMDCSGFTKTVYFLNGLVIPRDASQQVHTGRQIDEKGDFSNLEKGDLLFFGRKLRIARRKRWSM